MVRPSRPPRRIAPLLRAFSLLLVPAGAHADVVALLPPRGAAAAAELRLAAHADLARAVVAEGHRLADDASIQAATAGVADGVADAPDEYRAVGSAARADWVLVAALEPAVTSFRVELFAYHAATGRLESVAREVDRARSAAQTAEMVRALLRPEGIGAGELPWERAPHPSGGGEPQAAPATRVTVEAPRRRDAPAPEPERTPYAADGAWMASAGLGFGGALAAPEGALAGSRSLVGAARFGRAFAAGVVEAFGEVGGNLVGPRALWFDVGARLPLRLVPSLFAAPEATLGLFVRPGGGKVKIPDGTVYEGRSSEDAALRVGLAVILLPAASWQVEAAPELRALLGDPLLVAGARASLTRRF